MRYLACINFWYAHIYFSRTYNTLYVHNIYVYIYIYINWHIYEYRMII